MPCILIFVDLANRLFPPSVILDLAVSQRVRGRCIAFMPYFIYDCFPKRENTPWCFNLFPPSTRVVFSKIQDKTSDSKEDVYDAMRIEYHIVRGQWLLQEKQWFLFFGHAFEDLEKFKRPPHLSHCTQLSVLLLSKH